MTYHVYEPCLGDRFKADTLDEAIEWLNADLERRGYYRDACEATIQQRSGCRAQSVPEELWWDKIRQNGS